MTLSSPHGHHVTEGGSEITQQTRRDNTVEVRQQRINQRPLYAKSNL